MGKKKMKKSEEKHKIPAVGSGHQKQETRRVLRSGQKSVKKNKEVYRQRALVSKLFKIRINFSKIPPADNFCKETSHLCNKMVDRSRENLPEAVLGLLTSKLMEKFGRPYRFFVNRLMQNIWINVHLRCLQEDAGLSDEGMAEMNHLHLLRLLDGVNNTHIPSGERRMKALVTEFGLHAQGDVITELVEKMVEAFAKVAPEEAMVAFAMAAHDESVNRQMMLAEKLVKIPLNFSPVHPDQTTETKHLYHMLVASAKENVPEAVLHLLEGKLMDRFGRSYKTFVWYLWDNIWLKVHMRCLQEDAPGVVGFSDEEIDKMDPLHLLRIWDGVNSTHTPSGERKLKQLVTEFGLGSCYTEVERIITELVEKMVKAFALVAPDDAMAVFAKVAHDDAMDHAMALAVQGISLVAHDDAMDHAMALAVQGISLAQ